MLAERDLWIPFGFQTPISISLFRFLEEVLAPSARGTRAKGGRPFFSQFHSLSPLLLPSFRMQIAFETDPPLRSLRDV